MTQGKNKYFPNNWQRYKNAPDDMFMPHTFAEIMTYKIAGWELPDNVYCIIREKNLQTKKIKDISDRRDQTWKARQQLKKSGPTFT